MYRETDWSMVIMRNGHLSMPWDRSQDLVKEDEDHVEEFKFLASQIKR